MRNEMNYNNTGSDMRDRETEKQKFISAMMDSLTIQMTFIDECGNLHKVPDWVEYQRKRQICELAADLILEE